MKVRGTALFLILLTLVLGGGCDAITGAGPVPNEDIGPLYETYTGGTGSAATGGTKYKAGSSVTFWSKTAFPDGTVLAADLRCDDVTCDWWPADATITVEDGRWGIIVYLGRYDAPEEFEIGPRYSMSVRDIADPEGPWEGIGFDLVGPPEPTLTADE